MVTNRHGDKQLRLLVLCVAGSLQAERVRLVIDLLDRVKAVQNLLRRGTSLHGYVPGEAGIGLFTSLLPSQGFWMILAVTAEEHSCRIKTEIHGRCVRGL